MGRRSRIWCICTKRVGKTDKKAQFNFNFNFIFALFVALALLPNLAHAVTIPANVIAYLNITLDNSQSTATPAPFQQMLTVNSLAYQSYESNTLANIEFFYANGTIVPSWLESGNTNSSTNTIYWVKLVNGEAATSNTLIYMGFGAHSTSFFSNTLTGEAPQLSSTYAEYDNGANVFTNYWNFAGTALPSGFNSLASGGTYSVDNGLTLSTPATSGDYIHVFTTTQYPPSIVETYVSSTTNIGSGEYDLAYTTVETASGGDSGYQTDYRFDNYENNNRIVKDVAGTGTQITTAAYTLPSSFIMSGFWPATGNEYMQINYANQLSTTDNAITYANANLDIFTNTGTTTAVSSTTTWLRTRAYPPSGVMPTASFGPILFFSLSITPNPSKYGQSITLTARCLSSTDSCAIDYPSLGTAIATGTGTATYTYNAFALGAGTYSSYYANDITAGKNTTPQSLVVDQNSTYLFTLSSSGACASAPLPYTNCTTTGTIHTRNNALSANLFLNKNLLGATTTTLSSTQSNSIGNFNYVFNTTGNTNYTSKSLNTTYLKYVAFSYQNTSATHAITINQTSFNTYYPYRFFITGYPNINLTLRQNLNGVWTTLASAVNADYAFTPPANQLYYNTSLSISHNNIIYTNVTPLAYLSNAIITTGNVTIDKGVTLYTAGHPIITLGTFINNGIIRGYNTSIPNGVTHDLRINLSASWSSVHSTYVQQMLNLSESNTLYGSYLNYNTSSANFEYFYANGTVIPSWIESNTSGKIITWLKIKNTTSSLFIGFGTKGTNFLSASGAGVGEAPQLSPVYGAYDDGANVFAYYQRWGGLSALPSAWNNEGTNTYTFNPTSMTITWGNSNWAGLYTTAMNSNIPIITDIYGNFYNDGDGIRTAYDACTTAGCTADTDTEYGFNFGSLAVASCLAGNTCGASTAVTNATHIFSLVVPSVGNVYGALDYNTAIGPANATTTDQPIQFGFWGQGTTAYASIVYWVRNRVYPPSGVMPTAIMGALNNVSPASANLPNSYGGSGGAGGSTATVAGQNGYNTLVAGGLGAVNTAGGNGATPTVPKAINNTLLWQWYKEGIGNFLSGAAGGQGASAGGLGGNSQAGVMISASSIYAGIINVSGFAGAPSSTGGAGGGGGGDIVLAYSNTYFAGTYSVAGGLGTGTGSSAGGSGGAGQVMLDHYAVLPPVLGAPYTYQLHEAEGSASINVSFVLNMSMQDISSLTFNNTPCIQYLTCLATIKHFNNIPTSWQIKSDISVNQHINSTPSQELFSNANLTLPFFDYNGLLSLTYSQFSPAISFTPNATNNPYALAKMSQIPLKYVISTSANATERVVANFSIYDQETFSTISANMSWRIPTSINHYSFLQNVSYAPTTAQKYIMTIPHSTYLNPNISFQLNGTVEKPLYFAPLQTYCPTTLANGSASYYRIGLVDTNGTKYSFYIYTPSGGSAQNYILFINELHGTTPVSAQSLIVPTSLPMAVPLEQTGQEYQYIIYNPSCTSTYYKGSFVDPTNPTYITLTTGPNQAVIYNMTNVTGQCSLNTLNNPYKLICVGSDTSSQVYKYVLKVYKQTTILGTEQLLIRQVFNSSSFIYNTTLPINTTYSYSIYAYAFRSSDPIFLVAGGLLSVVKSALAPSLLGLIGFLLMLTLIFTGLQTGKPIILMLLIDAALFVIAILNLEQIPTIAIAIFGIIGALMAFWAIKSR